jgi:hypothetical protein
MGNAGSTQPDGSQCRALESNVQVLRHLRGRTTLRHFKTPFMDANYNGSFFLHEGSLAVSDERIVGHGRVLNMPWNDARARLIRFELVGNRTLVVSADAALLNSEWSGEIEYRFDLGRKAFQWFQRIRKLQNGAPKLRE